jgi:hypothetical protein
MLHMKWLMTIKRKTIKINSDDDANPNLLIQADWVKQSPVTITNADGLQNIREDSKYD